MTRTRSLIVAGLLASGGVLAATILPRHAGPAARPGPTSDAQRREAVAMAGPSFHVEWSADTGRDGAAHINGFVYNDNDRPADRLVLRIDELDASGRLVQTVLKELDDSIAGLSHARFVVRLDDPAASYNVSVESLDFVDWARRPLSLDEPPTTDTDQVPASS